MPGDKFDPQRFFAVPTAVAALATADELFGFLSRKLRLAPGLVALVTRQTGDHRHYAAGEEIDGGDAREVLFVRSTPIDLSWNEDRVASSDQYQGTAMVNLRVLPVAERGELLSFRHQILGSDRTADADTLIRYLRPGVRETLNRLAETRTMEVLVDAEDRTTVSKELADALAGPCFTAGLQLEAPPEVAFDSPTFRQVRANEERAAQRRQEHAARRQLQEAIETAQHDHLSHLEGLLGKLRTLADDSPEADLPDLVRSFRESERSEIYEALFATSSKDRATQWIVVAAGTELLFYDPLTGAGPQRTIPLGGEVGAVRSVQYARNPEGELEVLAGASRGVYAMKLTPDAVPVAYAVADAGDVRGGVNSAALAGDYLLASHSELGLLRWPRSEPQQAERLLSERTSQARAVRGVAFAAGRIYVSVDQAVVSLDADNPSEETLKEYSTGEGLVSALHPAPDGVYAGTADGRVLFWPAAAKDGVAPQVLHTSPNREGRPVESVRLVSEGGVPRLVFADTSLAIHTRVIGDTFACRYEAGGQTLRRVEAAPDLIVATNDIRDRLIVWTPGHPANPKATITVARQIGHSIQDVCLLPVV